MEGHLHLVAGRLDLVDRADPHAHDLDLVAGVQRVRRREIGHHGVVGQLLVELPADVRRRRAPAITTSDPMITDARDSCGSRRLRISKMVLNSGYLPLRRYRPLRPG